MVAIIKGWGAFLIPWLQIEIRSAILPLPR